MNRPARTLTWDLVRRRHPTGASPSREIAPGRTLSPMPSEQKGAYGGHLASYVILHRENGTAGVRYLHRVGLPPHVRFRCFSCLRPDRFELEAFRRTMPRFEIFAKGY